MNPADLTPAQLRPLLRQMTAEMGAVPAIMHWLTGAPPPPVPTGPHSRADALDAAYRGEI